MMIKLIQKHGLTALLAAFLIIYSCTNDRQSNGENATSGTISASEAHLGEHMRDLQYYTLKLGLSLQHHNQPLAAFYIGEVKEAYDDIADKKIEDEGIHITALIQQLLKPQLKEMQSVIEKNDSAAFLPSYHMLIQTCNNCHHD